MRISRSGLTWSGSTLVSTSASVVPLNLQNNILSEAVYATLNPVRYCNKLIRLVQAWCLWYLSSLRVGLINCRTDWITTNLSRLRFCTGMWSVILPWSPSSIDSAFILFGADGSMPSPLAFFVYLRLTFSIGWSLADGCGDEDAK